MKVKRIGKTSATEITLEKSDGDDVAILVSYETPVAAFIPGKGFRKTSKKWSSTTSKHISKWLCSHGVDNKEVETENQSFFDNLLSV